MCRLDQIMNVVRQGAMKKAPVERIADKIMSYFVPVITLLAILTWLIWLALGLSGALPHSYRGNEIGGWRK
jgi:cation transport ATPase